MENYKNIDYFQNIANILMHLPIVSDQSDLKRDMNVENIELIKFFPEYLEKFTQQEKNFLNKHEEIWNIGLFSSEYLYLLVNEFARKNHDYFKALSEKDCQGKKHLYIVIGSIAGRCVQQYLETISLLKNGFPDCALARWRSIYESVIIASFIQTDPKSEELSIAFLDAIGKEEKYEWAAKSDRIKKNKNNPSFSEIKKICGLPTYNYDEHYQKANEATHTNPTGIFTRIGDHQTDHDIAVWRSYRGVFYPAILANRMVIEIIRLLFNIYETEENGKWFSKIYSWEKYSEQIYCYIHDGIFKDEEPVFQQIIK